VKVSPGTIKTAKGLYTFTTAGTLVTYFGRGFLRNHFPEMPELAEDAVLSAVTAKVGIAYRVLINMLQHRFNFAQFL
jgi:hypothetical protein